MKKVLAVALALVLGAPVLTMAQTPAGAATEKKSGAMLTPDEQRYDFGTITQGEVAEHTFTFRNTGTEPLVISNVGVSCGCTVPEYSKEPVLPGKSGKITARFNSAGKLGMQNKVLTVSSNSAGGEVQLTMAGTVKEKDGAGATGSATIAPVSTPASAVQAEAMKSTPVAKGKVKVKDSKGEKTKVKASNGKVEVKK